MKVSVKPALLLWACYRGGTQPADLAAAFPRLARWLDGSDQPTVLRRLHELGHLSRREMWLLYDGEVERFQRLQATSAGGGDFYRTQRGRVGQRFTRAVIESTWEGRSSFTEANLLLNVKKRQTLIRLASEVGLEVS